MKIIALAGDGIGQEVTTGALQILRACAKGWSLPVEIEELPVGGAAIERHGAPLPDFVLEACQSAGIVLLGAVGAPQYDDLPRLQRPEHALLKLRKELELFANLRPVRTYPELLEASPLKQELIEGVDILIVRELTGGVYFGEPRGLETRSQGRVGFNTEIYYDWEIERIAHVAFEAAAARKGLVTSVDKSNVLESSQLWRKVVSESAAEHPQVRLEHLLIDNCAMQLVARPKSFDVILAGNMFGDILSDEAAMLTGSIGMLPSASLGPSLETGRAGMYEPVHGSAPDIAGRDVANPLAAIASVAMLLRHSL
ncbi:MAG TPA: 3-isopropylmalate dehydrogenase, partial [Acidobacteriota bacterium]|nr:3-isopropylmalate dehydrogenase [Acidobacteriota bacterium]